MRHLIVLSFVLSLGVASAAASDPAAGEIEVRVAADGPSRGASLVVTPLDPRGPALTVSLVGDAARIDGLSPGAYLVTVSPPPAAAGVEVRVHPGERVVLESIPPGAAGEPRLRVTERHRRSVGTPFDAEALRSLPSSRDAASLLETVEPVAIVEGIGGAGLRGGEPARVTGHGSSFTQTSWRLGGVDVTDPDRTGVPLFTPPFDALEAIDAATGVMPVEVGAPGPAITFVPRRPATEWRGTAQAFAVPEGLQGDGAGDGVPVAARFGSWAEGNVTVGGPLGSERARLLVSGTFTRARRLEAGDDIHVEADAAGGLAHLLLTPGPRDALTLLLGVRQAERPQRGREAASGGPWSRRERSFLAQSAWERRGNAAFAARAAYVRGNAQDEDDPAPVGLVERLRDGPIPELVLPGHATSDRVELGASLEHNAHDASARHHPRIGATFVRATATARSDGGPLLTAERLNGIPAHLWEYGYGARESRRRATELAAFAADRIVFGDRLHAELGVRFETTGGSAEGADRDVRWTSLSPRASFRAGLVGNGRLTAFGGWARYRHRLPLRALEFGDPAGPSGSVYRWRDLDGDGQFQERERRALVARVGPGTAALASIDPDLAAPRTDELILGFETRLGGFVVRFLGIDRHERDLLESVNVGVPLSAYALRLVGDPGGDILGPADDQLLPVHERLPGSFGQDRYLLTNPDAHTTRHQGAELTVEKTHGRLRVLMGATAHRSEGNAAWRGFRPFENDQGLVGELFDDPNSDTFARGRLFSDRAYTIKLSGTYAAPGDLRVGAVARYQDGQPFARLLVVPDLAQGPDLVRAIRNGRSRFEFAFTLDVRLEKGVRVGALRAAAVAEAFNLFDTHHEVEEDVVTGSSFRLVTVRQPPRALRFGLRLEF